jgi:hypothetical protein
MNDQTKMPKWLLYGLIAKGVIAVLITIAVVIWLSR